MLSLLPSLSCSLFSSHHAGMKQVQVLITDENDCIPEFLQSIYSVDGVPETVTTATSLLQGEASLTTMFCVHLFDRSSTWSHFE